MHLFVGFLCSICSNTTASVAQARHWMSGFYNWNCILLIVDAVCIYCDRTLFKNNTSIGCVCVYVCGNADYDWSIYAYVRVYMVFLKWLAYTNPSVRIRNCI